MSHGEPLEHLEGVAVIGMAGRFPGARDVEQFWQNIRAGRESVQFFDEEELLAAGVDPALLRDPKYVKAAATLDEIETFDAAFFGFSPREAEVMDPQHRLFLETAWSAMEHAGYDAEAFNGRIGVYAGTGLSRYLLFNLLPTPGLLESVGTMPLLLANDKDHLATRTAYKLNLTGPSVNLSTACSTSLVAVHLACQSLLTGETDMALAGGVSINVPQKTGYTFVEGSIMSPDGHCRAFAENAHGTVSGSGMGAVVLKRLEDAVADGDTIYAVIKGSAVGNDGAQRVGYTAPSVDGQSRVIAEALAISGVDPETIRYVEAHGTGTELGDPIEITALTEAFRASTEARGFCDIGSVKTNIGHLDAAAGVSGLIKTVLSLYHGEIAPSLHFDKPNPKIDFTNSPFRVNRQLKSWPSTGEPHRAGVSSFGMGGTNAHVVLEEAPPTEASDPGRDWQLLLLSAKSEQALERATDNLVAHLQAHPEQSFADVAYTLQVGRKALEHRRVLVCRDAKEAASLLAARDPKRLLHAVPSMRQRQVAFLFTGVGDQYVNMAYELYRDEEAFRQTVDHCCEMLRPHLGIDLRGVLFNDEKAKASAANPGGFDLRKMLRRDDDRDAGAVLLQQTIYAQPVLFVVEYALAQLLIGWGIRPQAMIGHSLGEYVAACLAGVFTLEDALLLVAKRAQLIDALPGGAMLAVSLAERELQPLLGDGLYLATVNAPAHCVVSGTVEAVQVLEATLQAKGVACSRVQTSHAFHSPLMEPILQTFTDLVRSVPRQPPQVPFVSNVTGTWAKAEEVTDPAYWGRHLCRTVRFAEGIGELCADTDLLLLEVGPGQTLSSFALQHKQDAADRRIVLPTLRPAYETRSDLAFLWNTLGQMWLEGVEIEWKNLYDTERRHRVPLPTYPFERQRFWIEPPRGAGVGSQAVGMQSAGVQDALAASSDVTEWFYTPSWKRSLPVAKAGRLEPCNWLVFADACGLSEKVVQRLQAQGQTVVQVTMGESVANAGPHRFVLNPQSAADYEALVAELTVQELLPQRIVHLWSVTGETPVAGEAGYAEAQQRGYYSLLYLAKALGKGNVAEPLDLWVIADHVLAVESTDQTVPEKATLLAPCKVIPQEYANITCRLLDIRLPDLTTRRGEQWVDLLLDEWAARATDRLICYRGHNRWVQTHEPLALPEATERPARLQERGVYLITGGLGMFGHLYAKYLAHTVQARLVLISRTGLPDRELWADALASDDVDDRTSKRIRNVQALEQLGAEVLVIVADVADEAQMRAAVAQAERKFGALHGVIHAAGLVERDAHTTIVETGIAESEAHFQARVRGAYVLERVLQGKALAFGLYVSSLSTVLGGIGLVTSTAAHLFMDAHAQRLQAEGDVPWLTVDWEPDTPDRMGEAIGRVLAMESVVPVVVSTRPLTARIKQWIEFATADSGAGSSTGVQAGRGHARPNLHNAYVAPRDQTEQAIVDIFQELLGIAEVGVHDNFFQLGGNSLIGTQLVTRLRSAFQVDLPLRILFEAATVAELAVTIEEILIAEIAQLSDEEIEMGLL